METQKKKNNPKFFLFIILLIASLALTACATPSQEEVPNTLESQPTESNSEVMIPVVGSGDEENTETGSDENAYPEPEQETQNLGNAEPAQDEAYPEPALETLEQSNLEGDAYPAPQEEPAQEIKPTPRGNGLVATDPNSVSLASGQVQLVEMFAFW